MRNRLIELLKKASYGMLVNHEREEIADYLLSEGVMVSPFKIGQKVLIRAKISDGMGNIKEDFVQAEVVIFGFEQEGFFAYCRYDNANYQRHVRINPNDVYLFIEDK